MPARYVCIQCAAESRKTDTPPHGWIRIDGALFACSKCLRNATHTEDCEDGICSAHCLVAAADLDYQEIGQRLGLAGSPGQRR
jgi:hypothetical protein